MRVGFSDMTTSKAIGSDRGAYSPRCTLPASSRKYSANCAGSIRAAPIPTPVARVYASREGRWLIEYRPRKTEGRLSRVAPKRFVIGDRRFVSLS